MSPLLTPSYWLSVEPANVSGLIGYVICALFVTMVIAGVVVRARRGTKKENPFRAWLYGSVARLLTTMGLIGLTLVFLSFENIRLLGARFWYPVLVVATALWVVWLVRAAKRQKMLMASRHETRSDIDKYLPKPRGR